MLPLCCAYLRLIPCTLMKGKRNVAANGSERAYIIIIKEW